MVNFILNELKGANVLCGTGGGESNPGQYDCLSSSPFLRDITTVPDVGNFQSVISMCVLNVIIRFHAKEDDRIHAGSFVL